jgi:hypothetical protein
VASCSKSPVKLYRPFGANHLYIFRWGSSPPVEKFKKKKCTVVYTDDLKKLNNFPDQQRVHLCGINVDNIFITILVVYDNHKFQTPQ